MADVREKRKAESLVVLSFGECAGAAFMKPSEPGFPSSALRKQEYHQHISGSSDGTLQVPTTPFDPRHQTHHSWPPILLVPVRDVGQVVVLARPASPS